MGIFKPCDIRGVYPDELDEASAELIGRAVATELRGGNCVLAGDVRLSTPALKDAMAAGLIRSGAKVWDIGIAPTPVAYWAMRHLGTDGVVVVTASHNPPRYNGVKLMLGELPVRPDDMVRLHLRVEQMDFSDERGEVNHRNVRDDYLAWIGEQFAGTGAGLRVLLDAGNGAASEWAPPAFRACGCSVGERSCTPDGSFPDRSPNPSSPEALQDTSAEMRGCDADFAACFDGDGDRVVFLDETGAFVPAEQAMILFARDALSRSPGSPIVYDLKCTRIVPGQIRKHGGVPVKERSGHAFIKRRMLAEDAVMAGEASGHFFFREIGGDDGIYAALRMGSIIGRTERPLSALLAELSPYHITGDIRIASVDPQGTVARIAERFAELPQDHTDGACIEFDGGWVLVRPSVTEPAVTVRVEGDDARALERIRASVLDALAEVNVPPPTSS